MSTRRAIRVKGTDVVLEISKAAAVKVDTFALHLDKLPDGTYRLLYNSNLFPDFKDIEAFEIVREE